MKNIHVRNLLFLRQRRRWIVVGRMNKKKPKKEKWNKISICLKNEKEKNGWNEAKRNVKIFSIDSILSTSVKTFKKWIDEISSVVSRGQCTSKTSSQVQTFRFFFIFSVFWLLLFCTFGISTKSKITLQSVKRQTACAFDDSEKVKM